MELWKFYEKRVRITTKHGEVVEGVCLHNTADFSESEYGVNEEGLSIASWLFFERDIEKVEEVGEEGFSTPFGMIEQETINDGIYYIEDGLFSEVTENALRLLDCIESRLDDREHPIPDREELPEVLKKLKEYSEDRSILEKTERLLEKLADEK